MFEIGVNINGDFDDEGILLRAELSKIAGKIWIGEFEKFRDPVEVAKIIEENLNVDIGLILTPSRCSEILKLSNYDICLIPGKDKNVKTFLKCLEKLSKLDVYVGCSGRILARKASKYCKKILANYSKPEYIRWLCDELYEIVVPIAPALVTPSDFEDELIMAAMLVMTSNKNFALSFGLEEAFNEVSSLDIYGMIKRSKLDRNRIVKKYEKFLIENFTVSGSVREVAKKVKILLKEFDGFIFADPFHRDVNSLANLKNILNML